MSDGVYLAGPLIALTMIVAMALALYRAFLYETARPKAGRLRPDDTLPDALMGATVPLPVIDDYGLLVTARIAPTMDDALLVQEHLRSAGIRTTFIGLPDDRVRVLVFADDQKNAQRVVGA
jgi:hypothetical protein